MNSSNDDDGETLVTTLQDPDRIVSRLVQTVVDDDQLRQWIHRLIAGDAPEDAFFTKLAALNQSSVCARSFQPDEHAFQCSTCGIDPTCIQCAPCFRLANHEGHDIKMTHAGGGGICDCGDVSSWSEEGFCSQHRGPGDVDTVDISDIPISAIAMIDAVITVAAKSILQIDDHYMVDKEILTPNPECVAHLFNDDFHSFNDIITSLRTIAGMPKHVAQNVSLRVDYFGRAIFAMGSNDQCQAMVDAFSAFRVQCCIRPRPDVVISEKRVATLMNILTDLSRESDAIRRVVCDLFKRSRIDVKHDSYMTSLMLASSISSSIVSAAMSPLNFQLFISGSFKATFTLAFAAHYDDIVIATSRPSHTEIHSALDYAVQLFTIPDLVLRLCHTSDLLGSFLATFKKLLTLLLKHDRGGPDAYRYEAAEDKVVMMGLRDLDYIVSNPGVCKMLYETRPDLLITWLDILRQINGLDMQVRQIGQHIDYESLRWWFAFRLVMQLYQVSKIFIRELAAYWTAADCERIFFPLAGRCIKEWAHENTSQVVDLGDGFTCPVFSIVSQPVSLHWPMQRFLVSLMSAFVFRTMLPPDRCLHDRRDIVAIVDNPVRAISCVSHFRSGIWVLNGAMLVQQASTYERIQARPAMLEPDLSSLQMAAVVMGPGPFINFLAYRFMVHDLVLPGYVSAPKLPDLDPSKVASIVESFVGILVAIVVERGPITVDKRWGLHRDIVHWLLVKDMTHSDILSRLSMDQPSSMIRSILDEVARFVAPNNSESGRYHLKKDAVVGVFDPVYWRYGAEAHREIASSVYVNLSGHRPSLPVLPEIIEPMRPLYDLISSSDLYRVLQKLLLDRTLLSSRMFLSMLRLISVGLRDAETNPAVFNVREFEQTLTSSMWEGKPSVFEILCIFIRDDNKVARVHVDYVHMIINGLRKLSTTCDEIATRLIPTAIALRQEQELQLQVEDRRRRRDAARAAAVGQIQNQIKNFSNTHTESLQEVTVNDGDVDSTDIYTCILCRSSESQDDIGLLSWMGKCQLTDLLRPADARCRRRPVCDDVTSTWTYSRNCGHAIHGMCYERYIAALLQKDINHEYFEGLYVVVVGNGEIMCPLCKSHANTLLPCKPAIPPAHNADNQLNDDVIGWVKKHLPATADRITASFDDYAREPIHTPAVEQFLKRTVDVAPDSSVLSVVVDDIRILDLQHRNGSAITEREFFHLRKLLGNACQYLMSYGRDRVSSMAASLKQLEFTQCASLPFIVECCLLFFIVEEPLEAILQLVHFGVACLRVQASLASDNAIDLDQLHHAQTVGNVEEISCKGELFSLAFLRQAAILISAMRANDEIEDLKPSSLAAYLLVPDRVPHLQEFLVDTVLGNVVHDGTRLPLAYVQPTLYPLPTSFLDLFDASARSSCPLCKNKVAKPVICLVCGQIMCSARQCRKGTGPLSFHTNSYLCEQGAFLSISQGSIHLICNGFSAEFSSPYLDEHEEEDIGLQRGRPLFLNAVRWSRIEKMVIGLEIGSIISRKRAVQTTLMPRHAL